MHTSAANYRHTSHNNTATAANVGTDYVKKEKPTRGGSSKASRTCRIARRSQHSGHIRHEQSPPSRTLTKATNSDTQPESHIHRILRQLRNTRVEP